MRIKLAIMAIVFSIGLSGCQGTAAQTPEYSDYNFSDKRTHWQGLQMYVADGSVTPTGLRLSMVNNNEELNFGHGVMFSIEKFANGSWEQVPFINDVAWILPLLNVAPMTTVDENISWEHMHGQLLPGTYRIVRNFIENDWYDLTPMWEREIPEAYLYTTFTVVQDWQTAHSQWQSVQENIAAAAYARFDGLDLEILEYSTRGLTFILTNNNPYYSYTINSIFVGWEDSAPDWGSAGALEYSIFNNWESDDVKQLQRGEYLLLEVDWYNKIGHLAPSMSREYPFNANIFDLVVDVTLDVDEEYTNANFRHIIPGLPHIGHRIKAEFDISN